VTDIVASLPETHTFGPLPPYKVLHDFFAAESVARLLEYVEKNEARFEASTIGIRRAQKPSMRVSAVLPDGGPDEETLRERIFGLVPSLIADLRVTPFQPVELEIEIVAHFDGAFFARHIDLVTGPDHPKQKRLLSAVYYFCREPKSFSGGQLRLYAFGSTSSNARFVDIEPFCNSLLVFPSWAPHEVRAVLCPSKRFIDSRFSINCWVLGE
jgi:Rps23 Pro-64 3,4-dihydroxylase Tpa1-like proline 4-hydroxylase